MRVFTQIVTFIVFTTIKDVLIMYIIYYFQLTEGTLKC